MNVLNVHDIERELAKASAQAIHPQIKNWIVTVARNHILGKLDAKEVDANFRIYTPGGTKQDPLMPHIETLPPWAIEAMERGETLHWFDRFQPRKRMLWQVLDMVISWFNTFEATDTRLRRVDRISFEVAAKAAALWFKDLSDNVWAYIKDKPPVVKSYDNGFTWVRLMTNLHFEREGTLMKHCVHTGGYFERWKRGTCQFFSLRDKDNNPHVTMQVDFVNSDGGKSHLGNMSQCKGSCNGKPGPRYQPYIKKFLRDMNFTINGDTHMLD